MKDDTHRPTAADRQRAYRQRIGDGEKVLSIRVGRKLVMAMLVSGRIDEKGSRNRKKLAAESGLVLEEWAEHWVK